MAYSFSTTFPLDFRNHPKAPILLNKKLASSSLASFFIIEGKHLLHLLLTSVVSQIV